MSTHLKTPTVSSLQELDLNQTYSYADYLTWKFEQFVELIKGKIFPMSAPKRIHQEVASFLHTEIGLFLRNQSSSCKLYSAPFDVRLVKNSEALSDKEIYSVVQPDICVVCDRSKLDERGCLGAPDLIVEILSESTQKKDLQDKFALYEENGVREYWIVSPHQRILQQFYLEDCRYQFKGFFLEGDTVKSHIFPELSVGLGELFANL
jgi:Uma2 family endonuclease